MQKKTGKIIAWIIPALNIALGWNWIHEDSGISGGIYFVNIMGGDPKHTYVKSTRWTCSETCKADWEDYINENIVDFNPKWPSSGVIAIYFATLHFDEVFYMVLTHMISLIHQYLKE